MYQDMDLHIGGLHKLYLESILSLKHIPAYKWGEIQYNFEDTNKLLDH